jgi:hypothetical protein
MHATSCSLRIQSAARPLFVATHCIGMLLTTNLVLLWRPSLATGGRQVRQRLQRLSQLNASAACPRQPSRLGRSKLHVLQGARQQGQAAHLGGGAPQRLLRRRNGKAGPRHGRSEVL